MKLRIRSVRAKMVLLLLPPVALALIALTVLAVSQSTRQVKSNVYASAQHSAKDGADSFGATAQHYMALGDEIARLMSGYNGDDRQMIDSMLHANLLAHPEILADYVGFLPGEFGDDAAYRNQPCCDAQGRYLPYWNRLTGKVQLTPLTGENNSAYYLQPEHTMKDSFIEPYLYSGVLMTSYTAPIIKHGKFVGIGGVDRSLKLINSQIGARHYFHTGYAFLVSHTGIFVASPNKAQVGTTTLARFAAKVHSAALAGVAAALRAGRSGEVQTRDPWTDKQVVMFYEPVEPGGWGYVVVVPTAEILAGVNSLRDTLIIIALAALVIVAIAIVLIATRLARPITRMSLAAEQIGEGDLNVEIPDQGEDEIGRMAQSFRGMVDYLRERAQIVETMAQGDLRPEIEPRSEHDALSHSFIRMRSQLTGLLKNIGHTAESVSSSSQQLTASSEESGRASDESGRAVGEIAKALGDIAEETHRQVDHVGQVRIAAEEVGRAISEIAKGAQSQVKEVQRVRTSAAEVSAAITDIARGAEEQVRVVAEATSSAVEVAEAAASATRNVQEAAAAAQETREVARAGVAAAEHASDAMVSVRDASQEVNGVIRGLAEKSEQIGEIVGTITGIAEQTNLLALNAAIEAARAGEQGRGFAVVAEEVRKLAEESQTAAAEIAGLIGAIQDQTERAVDVVSDGAGRTEEGVAVVGETRSAFLRIGDAVDDMAARVDQIASISDRIAANAARMQESIDAVAAVAEQASASAQQVAASAEQVSASADVVAASAEQASASAEEVSASAQQVSASADSVASSAEQASATTQELSASAEEVSASTQEVSASAQQVAASAHTLSESAHLLTELVAQFKVTDARDGSETETAVSN